METVRDKEINRQTDTQRERENTLLHKDNDLLEARFGFSAANISLMTNTAALSSQTRTVSVFCGLTTVLHSRCFMATSVLTGPIKQVFHGNSLLTGLT